MITDISNERLINKFKCSNIKTIPTDEFKDPIKYLQVNNLLI